MSLGRRLSNGRVGAFPGRRFAALGPSMTSPCGRFGWPPANFWRQYWTGTTFAFFSMLQGTAPWLQLPSTCASRNLRLDGVSVPRKARRGLLQRTTDRYILTLPDECVRTRVERIEEEALWIEPTIAGHDVRLEGIVRAASSQFLRIHPLAPCFVAFHARHPATRRPAEADIGHMRLQVAF